MINGSGGTGQSLLGMIAIFTVDLASILNISKLYF